MVKITLFICLVWLEEIFAVIYSINETEYSRMPSLFELDDYPSCMLDPAGTYCVLDVDLYAERGNELMEFIKEYSAHSIKHFNHTQIHRGICVKRTCKSHIENQNINQSLDLKLTLEACLNQSLYEEYGLMGRVADVNYCLNAEDKTSYDWSDIMMAVVYFVIIMCNTAGTFYDYKNYKREDKPANSVLMSFSMRRNWIRLTAPSTRGSDVRLDRLKLFNGLRTMTMICVFFSHTSLIMSIAYLQNPLYIEKTYDDPLKYIIYNGSLVTHTFFVMSAFLLAFNFMILAEKNTVTWWYWPKGVILRWLRLSPVYAVVLGTVCTWMRHAGAGPLWPLVVTSESAACRRYWWAHLLYVNNYVYEDAFCAPQTWYLAADTQLFCFGLLVCLLARSPRAQRWALLGLAALALAVPAAHTYWQELDPVVIQAPETYRSLYEHDDTFRLLYARGHTNLSTYSLGLAGGWAAYHALSTGDNFDTLRKHRWMFWLIFPVGVMVILSGGIFYIDGLTLPLPVKILYAILYKPVFQLVIVFFIIGCIFRFENLYRPIVEWRGWTWSGRVSYSAFLLHTLFQRGYFGLQTTPTRMSDYNILTILSATIFLSFITAAMLWLTVEAPLAQLVKTLMEPKKRRHLENNIAAAEAGDGQSKL